MKHLFEEFRPATAEEWKARLEKDLKGVTFDALSIEDRNGIIVRPFYTAADRSSADEAVIRHNGWSICEYIPVTDASIANRAALEALNNGASGLCFDIQATIDPAALLQDISLPYIYSYFNTEGQPAFAEKLSAYFTGAGFDITSMDCFVSDDFVKACLQSGTQEAGDPDKSIRLLSATGQLCVEAALYQNAGANSTTELGYVLAQVNEYLTLLHENGQTASLQKLHLTIATGTDFYEQIAKLRALRQLLQLLLEQYGLDPVIHIHVETSNLYRAPFDSYSNLLRDTIAGMAAVTGGCNSLYIHPFDETRQAPGDFSKRIARNQQLIFREESYLDKTADVAAGSYYIETLTDQLAEKAWNIFRETEAAGGLLTALGNGSVPSTLQRQAAQLVQEYKDGKRVLIGVNKFPNAQDAPEAAPHKEPKGPGIHPLLLSDEIL